MSDDATQTDDVDVAALQTQSVADQATIAQLQRTNAFLAVGINPDDASNPLNGLLFRAYDGDLTADAIRAAAQQIGLLQDATVDATVDASQATRDLLSSSGAPSGGAPADDPDPRDQAMIEFHLDRKRGVPLQKAKLTVVDKLLAAAVRGDKRVLYRNDKWLDEMENGRGSRQLVGAASA